MTEPRLVDIEMECPNGCKVNMRCIRIENADTIERAAILECPTCGSKWRVHRGMVTQLKA